ncbi:MAG: serine hydrolase [Chloroflexi bacterium]|nr:serine hydrolase [Chloroflexota bacterium]
MSRRRVIAFTATGGIAGALLATLLGGARTAHAPLSPRLNEAAPALGLAAERPPAAVAIATPLVHGSSSVAAAQPPGTPARAGTAVAVLPHSPAPTLVPATVTATPDPRLAPRERLGQAMLGPFQAIEGRFGIACKHLGTGLTVTRNDRLTFGAASLFKLPVMYSVFKQRQVGALDFGEELTLGDEAMDYDLGTLAWPLGSRVTLGTALERMIVVSDNSSAYMLTQRVGGSRINEDASRLGLTQTWIHSDDLSTSAGDMLRLLELIAIGQAVDPASSAEMAHLLARQQVRDRIPAMLPEGTVVANKTGDWDDVTHDVAIVYAPRGTFVLALLSDHVADRTAVHSAMARAALNVYLLLDEPPFARAPGPELPGGSFASYALPAVLPTPTTTPTPTAERRPSKRPAATPRATSLPSTKKPAGPRPPATTTSAR